MLTAIFYVQEEKALRVADKKDKSTIEDHLGNKYQTLYRMCEAYGIRSDTFCQRRRRGWTLEEALTGQKKSDFVTDHKGVTYPNLDEMCRQYGTDKLHYIRRTQRGWTVEEALSGIKQKSAFYDHLGNAYPSQANMCKTYGIKVVTFRARLAAGYTLEEALTLNMNELRPIISKTVSDHLGNTYPSIKAMCAAYHIKPSAYQYRIKKGLSTEVALTTKLGEVRQYTGQGVSDHLGNPYSSIQSMCNAYNINLPTYRERIKNGLSIEEALTAKPGKARKYIGKGVSDHLGNTYRSLAEMVRAYGLTEVLFSARKKLGWDLERCLTHPLDSSHSRNHGKICHDHLGNEYSSTQEMLRAYGVNSVTYYHRIKAGCTVEQALLGIRPKK